LASYSRTSNAVEEIFWLLLLTARGNERTASALDFLSFNTYLRMAASDEKSGDDLRQAQDLVIEPIGEIKPEDIARQKRRTLVSHYVLAAVAIAVLVAVVVLAVTLSRDGDTPVPVPPSVTIDDRLKFLLGPSFEVAQSNSSSPQAKAMAWLKNDTQIDEYEPHRLQQRYALAVLYFATGGESWLNSTGWLSNSSECEWYSFAQIRPTSGFDTVCLEESRFSVLNLAQNNLTGTVPPELELLNGLQQLQLIDPRLTLTIYSEL
jgi:hypothetical protein